MPSIIPDDSPLRVFKVFAELVWKHLGLPPLTPRQKEICDWLQYGPKRSQTWAFRGIGKSYLCSAYACWLLLLNPEEKVLVISACKERADQFVQFTRRLVNEMPILSHLIPNRLRGDRDSAVSFDVGAAQHGAHVPSVRAVGITGSVTGSRGSTIILDDVEVPGNSATPVQREKLSEAVKEVDAVLLPADEATGVDPKVRILGTPQSMETVYLQLAERDYVPRIWPVELPNEQTRAGYRGRLAPSLQKMLDDGDPAGTPTEPTRFDRQDIQERRISYGSLSFALQFMLSTALSDAEKYPIKIRDAMFAPFSVDKVKETYVHSNHPQFKLPDMDNPGMDGDGFYQPAEAVGDWVEPQQTIVCVDPSGRGRDETAIISASIMNGYIFVHRVFGSVKGYEDSTLQLIAEEAKRVRADRVVVEDNFGNGMYSQLLRPLLKKIYPCHIEEIKVTGVKEQRILSNLCPIFEGHKIVFHESVPKADLIPHEEDSLTRQRDRQLFHQISHITDERGCLAHDDRADCLSLVVESFREYLGIDSREEMRNRDFDKLMAQLEGDMFEPAKGPGWLDSFNSGGISFF